MKRNRKGKNRKEESKEKGRKEQNKEIGKERRKIKEEMEGEKGVPKKNKREGKRGWKESKGWNTVMLLFNLAKCHGVHRPHRSSNFRRHSAVQCEAKAPNATRQTAF